MAKAPGELVYFPDDRPGVRRKRAGRGFSYFAPDGTRIDDPAERKRINALAVPPAYENVWICPLPNGHLQATGRDERQRKQYRYHPDWTAFRSRRKYEDLPAFGAALPRIRRRIARDLGREAGEHAFALAAVISLIDRTGMRVGSADYAAENGTFGATTLLPRHVDLTEGEIRMSYSGKGGSKVHRRLRDKRLHRVLQALDDLPGRDLVSWIDANGNPHRVASEDVNEYLSELAERNGITAKTFRTWTGTLAAFETATHCRKPTIKAISEAAAERLHNTPAISRSSYIHPKVLGMTDMDAVERAALAEPCAIPSGLRKSEAAMFEFLDACP